MTEYDVTIRPELKINKEDFYVKCTPCDCKEKYNDDDCWCFMGIGRASDRNRGIDKLFELKETYGFTNLNECANTGCITFNFDGDMYYYGPVSKKFKKKGTSKWFRWSTNKNKKGESTRVLGKCITCNKDIKKTFVRCYNCNLDYQEKKMDKSIDKDSIAS